MSSIIWRAIFVNHSSARVAVHTWTAKPALWCALVTQGAGAPDGPTTLQPPAVDWRLPVEGKQIVGFVTREHPTILAPTPADVTIDIVRFDLIGQDPWPVPPLQPPPAPSEFDAMPGAEFEDLITRFLRQVVANLPKS